MAVRVQSEPFDAAAEARALTAGRADVGAVVTFVGLCRDEGGTLAALELEHYPGMAEEEISRVVAEAQARWPLMGATAIHRYGKIAPGEDIVLVVTASAHRAAAFAARLHESQLVQSRSRPMHWRQSYSQPGATTYPYRRDSQ